MAAIESVDQRSGRLLIWFVGIIAVIGMAGVIGLINVALSKPAQEVAAYMAAVASLSGLVGVLIGGLVNAMTVRSGGSVEDLGKVVDMTKPAAAAAAVPPGPATFPAPAATDTITATSQPEPVWADPLLDELAGTTIDHPATSNAPTVA